MNVNLNNKAALITGGGSGIGQAIAVRLAGFGASVVLVGRRVDKLEETKKAVEAAGGRAYIFPGDVTDAAFRRTCIEKTVEVAGRLDILVNNAGMAENITLEETSEDLYDKIQDVNAKAPYFLCQEALPALRQSDMATIINIASVVGHEGYENQSAYVASKHALTGFTKSLAREVSEENIRVHLISPGGVYTDLIKIARPDLSPDGLILPEDIANIVAFYLYFRHTDAVVDEIRVHRSGKTPFA